MSHDGVTMHGDSIKSHNIVITMVVLSVVCCYCYCCVITITRRVHAVLMLTE